MPILNKAQIKRKVMAANVSTSLHKGNEEDLGAPEESGQGVVNNMSVDTLIDPEDYESAGSTHFDNEDTSHPVLANKKIKANPNADGDQGGTTLNPGTTNVGTIDNDVDPDQGYIGASEDDEFNTEPEADEDAVFDPNDEGTEVEGSDTELQNNMGVDKLEAGEDEADWDDVPDDSDVDLEEETPPEEDAVETEDVVDMTEDVAAGTEDLSILDIDETPDTEVDDVAFATAGTRLLCIKANRIIATMTPRRALATNRKDVYLSDQFQQVTAMQLQSKGLRRGLKSMGFALATVSLAKQSTLKAQVQKEVYKTEAAVRRVASEKEKAFEQSLAIASVGLNSRMFKGVENELKASLEGELRRLNIRGANKILTRAFAEHGPAYAKQIIELAKKISAMPEEVRDGYVDALDMSSPDMDVQDEDVIPIGAAGDAEFEDMEDDFGEEISASMSRPGHVIRASVAANGNYSVTANEMLNGSRPLF